MQRLSRRRVLGVAIGGVLALALIAGLLVWWTSDGPDDVVRAYLTAIRERKVDDALRIAKVDRPPGDSGGFLTANAIGTDWTIGTMEVQNAFGDEAEVAITLASTSASLYLDPNRARGRFKLVKEHGGWRITDPLVEVSFGDSPLWYVEAGDVRLPRDRYPVQPGGGPAPKFLMFPGIYRTYAAHTDLVTMPPVVLSALPGNGGYLGVSPAPTVTDQGNRTFQQASDALLDECLAAQAKPDKDCTFNDTDLGYRTAQGYVRKSDVQTSAWKVLRYPAVNLPGSMTLYSNGLEVFSGQITIPGELQLTASGLTENGKPPVSFTMACLVTNYELVAGIKADGSMSVVWLVRPGAASTAKKSIRISCY